MLVDIDDDDADGDDDDDDFDVVLLHVKTNNIRSNINVQT